MQVGREESKVPGHKEITSNKWNKENQTALGKLSETYWWNKAEKHDGREE